jgi:hypothetical protein
MSVLPNIAHRIEQVPLHVQDGQQQFMSAKVLKTWDEHLLHLRPIVGGFSDRRTW